MSAWKVVLSGVGVCLLALCGVVPADAEEMPRSAQSEKVTNGFDPAEWVLKQQALYDSLKAETLAIETPGISARLSADEKRSLSELPASGYRKSLQERRQRVGIVKPVTATVDFRRLRAGNLPRQPSAFSVGQLFAGATGLTWTGQVEAVGATAVRVHFTAVRLPANAELYVLNDGGEAYGPYTGASGGNSFWSHTLSGPKAYVLLRMSGDVSDQDLRGTHFTIRDVAYIGADFQYVNLWESCRSTESCVRLASDSDPDVVDDAKKAVAHMQFISGPYIYMCSGGLLADTDPATERNYFLTANHCIDKDSEASSLETFFLYSQCETATRPPGTLGATLLGGNRTGDYTLLELDGQVPLDAMRLGWTSQQIATSDDAMLYRISHPAGAPQAFSEHRVDTSAPTCRGWPRGPWIYSRDVLGATQGGSSGSPVVNSAGLVVGQLTGACGYNVNDVCDSTSNATVDGAFASYFTDVRQWLDSGPSGGNQTPTAGFTYSDSGLSVAFTDTSSDPDGSIASWAWSFGDGATSNSQNPEHTYAAPGTYSVTLTVTDSAGATDDDTQSVSVEDSTVPAGSTLLTSSENNGRTWTAHVRHDDGSSLSGTWSDGTRCENQSICSLPDIRKRVSSVTFTSAGEEVTVLKP